MGARESVSVSFVSPRGSTSLLSSTLPLSLLDSFYLLSHSRLYLYLFSTLFPFSLNAVRWLLWGHKGARAPKSRKLLKSRSPAGLYRKPAQSGWLRVGVPRAGAAVRVRVRRGRVDISKPGALLVLKSLSRPPALPIHFYLPLTSAARRCESLLTRVAEKNDVGNFLFGYSLIR